MIYGVYFAYAKQDVLPEDLYNNYPTDYPSEIAKVHTYKNEQSQLDAYANTMCSVSQMITVKDEKEFNERVMQLKLNFDNKLWVEENIEQLL